MDQYQIQSCLPYICVRPAPKQNQYGFSLLELMVVIGIVSILVSMTLIGVKSFKVNAMRTEAYTTINHLVGLEEAYFSQSNTYAEVYSVAGGAGFLGRTILNSVVCNFSEGGSQLIGFRITPCDPGNPLQGPRYAYRVDVSSGNSYLILAVGYYRSLLPDCVPNQGLSLGLTSDLLQAESSKPSPVITSNILENCEI